MHRHEPTRALRRLIPLLAILVLLAPASLQAAWPAPAESRKGMVASASPEATAAGVEILRAGGNAVDAAVAVGFALAVAEPHSSGLGGGGFMVVHLPASGDRPASQHTLDYRERAPAAATADMYVKDGVVDPDASRWGGDAVAVPGTVAGLVEAHRRWGRLPLERALAPAVRLARDGVPVGRRVAAAIGRQQERLGPAATKLLIPGGQPLAEGERLVQPALARTIERVATDGGTDFYRGETAEALVAAVRGAGGRMTLRDLMDYRVVERPPVRGRLGGRWTKERPHLDVVSMGPPSSGGVHLVQMINTLEAFPLARWRFGAADTLHVMAEAMRAAYADRARYLGDPDFFDVPIEWLVSRTRAEKHSGAIKLTRAGVSRPSGSPPPPPDGNTTHLSVMDGEGGAVAATHTLNLSFGSGVLAAEAGVFLNNEMDDFSAAPGVPNAFGLVGGEANAIAPGKRPLSSMCPTLVLKDGRPVIAAGSPGGSTIITTTLQILLNMYLHDMDVAAAVAAPRMHHQWLPDVLRVDEGPAGFSPDTLGDLERRGHTVVQRRPWGNATAVAYDPDSGIFTGAADPRGDGTAAGP